MHDPVGSSTIPIATLSCLLLLALAHREMVDGDVRYDDVFLEVLREVEAIFRVGTRQDGRESIRFEYLPSR